MKLQGEAVCAPPCVWRRGSQPAATVPTDDASNDELDLTGPFFSKRFCHPVTAETSETDPTNVETCMQYAAIEVCEEAHLTSNHSPCAWTTGAELIPSHDFCAPTNMP